MDEGFSFPAELADKCAFALGFRLENGELFGFKEIEEFQRQWMIAGYSAALKTASNDTFGRIDGGVLTGAFSEDDVVWFTWEGTMLGRARWRRAVNFLKKAGIVSVVKETEGADARGNKVVTKLMRPIHSIKLIDLEGLVP